VEGSGANPMLELTRLISAQRTFEGTNSLVEGTESSLQNAIRTLGEPGK
jgi:flagellar basal-body rod protein FlgF